MGTAHYKVILAYDGSAFAGFQRQLNERTVQGEFEAVLRKLGWRGTSIQGAGRTDAGVHARAQVVSCKLDWNHSTEDLLNALNYYLPSDMGAQSVTEVPDDFNPRFDAKARHYRYHLFCHPVRDPLREVFAWRVWPEVDITRMNDAARDLIGSYDFAAFGSPTSPGGATVREVYLAAWCENGGEYQFDIQANAFLYHMVRRITMALVKIGQGEAAVSLIGESLKSGKMDMTGLAPAEGLFLQEVIY
ncbi:MAG: tRNA pseudouridine(38-40) synthase TruA [Brevefilum sp.]